jgi:hypothetical protein
MKKRLILSVLICVSFSFALPAQDFQFYPGASYRADIPTLEQVVGHGWGEQITMHHEVERYIHHLAGESPNVEFVKYGETWEGRSLYYLIVASEANVARIEEVKSGMQKLADPRSISKAEAEQLIGSLPSITWLAYGVHGNEISSTDAALLTAYHFAAAQNDTLAESVLQNSVVILDPMQNPDGRDRFISYFRQTRGRWPDENQQSAEHRETWPGGRTNHYLFDMNRDWFARTQPETRGKVKTYLEWHPQVFVDLHEMGSNSTYYFAPPADPINPEMPASQIQWLRNYGKNNAKWFDRMRFDYFSREVFDSFYPGYGEGWPMFHGSVGMTYEQASSRGLVVKRSDETVMHYRHTIQHHFISSLSTCETTARNREGVLRYFYEYRQSAIDEGRADPIKEVIIAPGKDPNRAAKLATNLMEQGIEVQQASSSFTNGKVEDYYDGGVQSKTFPAGSYVVSMAQPAKRLAKTLLAKQVDMDEEFIKEQLRRQKKRMGDQIYDVTGWSLPLLYDVECYMARQPSRGQFAVLEEAPAKSSMLSAKPELAYLIPWGSNSAARALARLFREKIRVFSTDKPFTLSGKKYPSGTLIIKVKDNPENLHERLAKIAEEEDLEVDATNTAWVEEGVNFGSGQVNYLKKPKIAMAYNRPTSSYSAGWTRYTIEQAYGYPVTIIHSRQLGGADLTKFNVLILPNAFGGYAQTIGANGAQKIKEWIRSGGTLVTYGQATQWLTGEKVGLLSTNRELKGGKPDKPEKKPDDKSKGAQAKEKKPDLSEPFDVEKEIQPEKELPTSVPGAILRVKLDTEQWLAFGYDGDANVIASSRNIFTPLKLDKGRNVGLYMPEDKVLLSGFIWEDTKKQIANKAYLMHQRHGSGHVVAFAEDPNYRAFFDGLNLLLINAVFLGPSH